MVEQVSVSSRLLGRLCSDMDGNDESLLVGSFATAIAVPLKRTPGHLGKYGEDAFEDVVYER